MLKWNARRCHLGLSARQKLLETLEELVFLERFVLCWKPRRLDPVLHQHLRLVQIYPMMAFSLQNGRFAVLSVHYSSTGKSIFQSKLVETYLKRYPIFTAVFLILRRCRSSTIGQIESFCFRGRGEIELQTFPIRLTFWLVWNLTVKQKNPWDRSGTRLCGRSAKGGRQLSLNRFKSDGAVLAV